MNAQKKANERLDPWVGDVDEIQSFLHIQRYEYALKKVNGVVLDVGCGLGYGSGMLYRNRKSIVACDISDTALLDANRKYPGPTYIRADAQALPFKDTSFDSIIALEIIEHVNSGIRLLQEAYRVLKKEGILVLSTPNVAHLRNRLKCLLFKNSTLTENSENPYHKHEYTPKELTKLLQSTGFAVEKKWGQILTFPLVQKLPVPLCVNTGRSLPAFSLYIIYNARKRK